MPDRREEDDISPGELRRSLERMEKALASIAERFDRLAEQYVGKETYQASAKAQGERIGALEKQLVAKADAEALKDTRRVANWAFALVAVASFGAIVTGILTVVAKGHP